jgi:hypothetical protein
VLRFHPESDLVDARAKIRQAVDIVLEKLQAGILPDDIELASTFRVAHSGLDPVVIASFGGDCAVWV